MLYILPLQYIIVLSMNTVNTISGIHSLAKSIGTLFPLFELCHLWHMAGTNIVSHRYRQDKTRITRFLDYNHGNIFEVISDDIHDVTFVYLPCATSGTVQKVERVLQYFWPGSVCTFCRSISPPFETTVNTLNRDPG